MSHAVRRGSLGGPVEIPKLYNGHDKTFFFFAYEGLRQGSASNTTTTVPTPLQRIGDFSQTRNAAGQLVVIYDPTTTVPSGSGYVRQPFAGNIIPAGRIDPVSANVLKYYPVPNQPGAVNSGLNNYHSAGNAVINSDTIDAKVDENISDKHRLFGRYSSRNLQNPATLVLPKEVSVAQRGSNIPQVSHSAALDDTYTISPTLLYILMVPVVMTTKLAQQVDHLIETLNNPQVRTRSDFVRLAVQYAVYCMDHERKRMALDLDR